MISIIICTYNRDKYIYNALKSIAENDYPYSGYEIILVDNNCTDNTKAVCAQFNADYPEVVFRYLEEQNQGLSHARNRGIKKSTSEILVFVDDDATVFEWYLFAIQSFFEQHPTVLACGGPIVPIYETGKPKWMSYYTSMLLGGALYQGDKQKPFRSRYPGGGNSAFRKETFEKYGVFNVELGRKGNGLIGAEEKDLYDRLKKGNELIYYLPEMGICHHISEKKLTKEYFNELTYSIGKSERIRTKSISGEAYHNRVFSEFIKWCGSVVYLIGYTFILSPTKGTKLIRLRWNLTKGLLGK